MSKMQFAAKLAASTRKAKDINTSSTARTTRAKTQKASAPKKTTTKPTKSTRSTTRARKVAKTSPAVVSKSVATVDDLSSQKDLLNPTDLERHWKKNNLVRIWPD